MLDGRKYLRRAEVQAVAQADKAVGGVGAEWGLEA